MLHSFLLTIYQVFLPISLPVIGGALLRYFRDMDTKSLSMLSLYVLCPALIFEELYNSHISIGDIWLTLFFTISDLLLLWGVSVLLGKFLSLSAQEQAGLTLVATLTNSVNYGLPLVLLAFGPLGLEKAAVYVIIQIILVNTIGVYFAARSQFTAKRAVISIFKMPTVYAAVFAVLFRLFDLSVPDMLDKGLVMMSDSYSPVVLAILGAQMINVKAGQLSKGYTGAFRTGIVVRIFSAPLFAWLILYTLSVKGVLFSVLLVLASMPAAVNAVILAEEFNAAPRLVSKCIFWTTVSSFVYLPILLKILNG